MDHFIVYTDGAASGNPGPGGYGYVIFDKINQKIIENGGSEPHTTNNKMELKALLEVLRVLSDKTGRLEFYIDSQYVLNGAQKWVYSWEKNGFKTAEGKEVQHRDLWIEILEHLRSAKKNKLYISWNFVKGHSNSMGNERADQISVLFSKDKNCELFEGDYKDYPLDLEKKSEKFIPYYLAHYEGQSHKFETWKECEEFVKGKNFIKYKKINNELEAMDFDKKTKTKA